MTKETIMIEEQLKEKFTVEEELEFYKQFIKSKWQEVERLKEENKLAKEIITKAVVDFSIEIGTPQYDRLLEGAKEIGIEVLDEH